jgi:hypothetical protein
VPAQPHVLHDVAVVVVDVVVVGGALHAAVAGLVVGQQVSIS